MAKKNLYKNNILQPVRSCGAIEEFRLSDNNLEQDTTRTTSKTPSDISSSGGIGTKDLVPYSPPSEYEGVSNIKDIYNVQKQIIEARRAQGGLKSDESIIWIPVVINIYALPEECDSITGEPLGFGVGNIPSKKWWYNLIDIMNLIFAGEYEGQGPDITSLGLHWDDDDNYVKAIHQQSHGIRSRIRFAIAPNDPTGSDLTTPALNIIPILKALEDVPFAVPLSLGNKTILPGSGGYTPTDEEDTESNDFIDNQGRGLGVGSRKKYLIDYLGKSADIEVKYPEPSNFISGREADNPGGAEFRDQYLILNFAQLVSDHGTSGSAQFPGNSSNKIVFINSNDYGSSNGQDYANETFNGKFVSTVAHEIGHALGLWHNFDHINEDRSPEEQIFLTTYFKVASHKASYLNAASQNLFNVVPNNIHLLYLKSSTYEHTESNVLFEDSIMHDPSDNPLDPNYVPEFHFDNLLQKRQEYESYITNDLYQAPFHVLDSQGHESGKIPTLKRFNKVNLQDILNINMSSFKNIVCDPDDTSKVNINLFLTSEIYSAFEENGMLPLTQGLLSSEGKATYGIGHANDYGNPYSSFPNFSSTTTVATLFSYENCPCLYNQHKFVVSGLFSETPNFEYRYPIFPVISSLDEDNNIVIDISKPNFYFPSQTITDPSGVGNIKFNNNISYTQNTPDGVVNVMPTNVNYTESYATFPDLAYKDFLDKFRTYNNNTVGASTTTYTPTFSTLVNHIHKVYTTAGFYLTEDQKRKFETYITDYQTQVTPGKVRSEFYGNLHASFYGSCSREERENYDFANIDNGVQSIIDPWGPNGYTEPFNQIWGNWYDLDSDTNDIFNMHLARYSHESLRNYTATVPPATVSQLSANQLSNPAGLFSIGGAVGPRLTKSKLIQKSLDTFGRYPLTRTGLSTMSWSSIFNIMNYRIESPNGNSTLNGTFLLSPTYVDNRERYANEIYTSTTTFSPHQLLLMEYNVLKGDYGFNVLTSFSETLQASGWPLNTMYIEQTEVLCIEGLQVTSVPYYQYYIVDGVLQTEGPYTLEENFYSLGDDLVDTSGNFYNGVFSYNPSTTELLDADGNILYSLANAVQANIDLNLGETVEKMKKFSAIYNKIVNFTN